jgi:hypothetical protein
VISILHPNVTTTSVFSCCLFPQFNTLQQLFFSSIRKNNLKIVHKLFQLYQQNIAKKKEKKRSNI